MPFISDDLSDVQEAKPAREGEYDLRILRALERPSNSGKAMAEIFIAIEDPGTDAPAIRHYIVKWDSDTPDEQVLMRKREYKRFCKCFSLDETSEVEDWAGATGRSLVIQEEGDDGNIYNRLRLPKLQG